MNSPWLDLAPQPAPLSAASGWSALSCVTEAHARVGTTDFQVQNSRATQSCPEPAGSPAWLINGLWEMGGAEGSTRGAWRCGAAWEPGEGLKEQDSRETKVACSDQFLKTHVDGQQGLQKGGRHGAWTVVSHGQGR